PSALFHTTPPSPSSTLFPYTTLFRSLMEHLASRGITCPQPVKNKGGGMLGTVAGRPAAVITFLDGMWIRRPSATHCAALGTALADRKSTRLNSSHVSISYAVFCLKKK